METAFEIVSGGKTKSAWLHGMYARKLLLDSEQRAAFETLREALAAQWKPRNVTEWMLIDHLSKQQWRLMRAGDAEVKELLDLSSNRWVAKAPSADRAAAALAYSLSERISTQERVQQYQQRLERSILRLIGQLMAFRKARKSVRKLGGLSCATSVEKLT